MGAVTVTGNKNWSTESIQRILRNEKYAGDVLLQKTYTANFIDGKIKKNDGELPQYYIKDNHPKRNVFSNSGRTRPEKR